MKDSPWRDAALRELMAATADLAAATKRVRRAELHLVAAQRDLSDAQKYAERLRKAVDNDAH